MNEADRTHTALVFTEYHLFRITDPQGAVSDDLDPNHNGLVSATAGDIEVLTGIHTGDVEVAVELHTRRPDPAAGWEEAAEISCRSPSGDLLVTPLMDDPADLPSLAHQGPGGYRLRLHATGRDRAVDGTSTHGVVESYLVQSWPAAHQDAFLVKAADAYGSGVRARPARDTVAVDHEDSPGPRAAEERDILRRAERGDFSWSPAGGR
ncbi:hypothetical protein [Streptomyces sp. NPDC093094]|uniref:hypothetical protein n=1 Tax=Streptomyces sp. NPDC093094 TaxID=3366026 RepID=UPI0037F8D3F5